mgnify:CR=1 FL=1
MESTINSGDTAWVLVSTALVMVMTPALAFFYGGMVRAKNLLAMLMMNYVAMGVVDPRRRLPSEPSDTIGQRRQIDGVLMALLELAAAAAKTRIVASDRRHRRPVSPCVSVRRLGPASRRRGVRSSRSARCGAEPCSRRMSWACSSRAVRATTGG